MNYEAKINNIQESLDDIIEQYRSIRACLADNSTQIIELSKTGIRLIFKLLRDDQDRLSEIESLVIHYQLATLLIYAHRPLQAKKVIRYIRKNERAQYMIEDLISLNNLADYVFMLSKAKE